MTVHYKILFVQLFLGKFRRLSMSWCGKRCLSRKPSYKQSIGPMDSTDQSD